MKRVTTMIAAASLAAAIGTQACGAAPESDADVAGDDGASGKADTLFANGPMYLTGGFDGSKKFQMWVDTMDFARHIKREYGQPLSWAYFINTCYFDTSVKGSWIGKAHSQAEVTVRWALVQQAVNEGHEIGNHSVRHRDGGEWSYDQWRQEFQEWHDLVETNLFRAVYEPGEGAVFPKWRAMPDASAGETGASCLSDGECNSGNCLAVSDSASFCTDTCNGNKPCANGTLCGAPDWNQSKDFCIPMPEFPVVHNGEVMFDENGTPNLEHPDLKPYRATGFRAPQLAHNTALFEVLDEFGYRYDTSKILGMAAPKRVAHGGRVFNDLYEFALMKNKGSLSIPMDYNYKVNDGSYERMVSDYKKSVVDNYNKRGRLPWNIGHHFALWRNGGYWEAMKDTFEFAAQGCPDAAGELQCDNVEFPNFNDLSLTLDGKADGVVDPFVDPHAEGEHNDVSDCPCQEEESH
jgi:peptidoglycan/xylan/chitin deacetylase (PgdA/CDA1 family)